MTVRLMHVLSGAVVSVSDEKAARLGSEWAPVAEKKAPAKKAAPKPSRD